MRWRACEDAAPGPRATTAQVSCLSACSTCVFSPITRAAFQDFGAAMGSPILRFWAVEHSFGMVIAVALAHVGRVRVRKTTDPSRRQRLAAMFFGLALILIFATIPWPGMPAGRPLLRGF